MPHSEILNPNNSFVTANLKIASLILSKVENCSITVVPNGTSTKKDIKIQFPQEKKGDVDRLISEFLERKACVNLASYNRALTSLREKLHGKFQSA